MLRLPTLSEPRWHPDEAVYTVVGWATSHGIPLYTGVFDASPPGIYWLYRLLLWLGAGSNHIVVQLVLATAVLASAFLTVLLAMRLLSPWAAWTAGFLVGFALSLPTLDGDILNSEIAALPFFLGALVLVLRRPKSELAAGSQGWLDGLAGALAAVAILIRPSYGLEAIVLLAVVLRGAPWRRRIVSLGLGMLTMLAATALQLASTGSLGPYFSQVMPMNHAYLLMSNDGSLRPLMLRLAVLGAVALFAVLRTWRTRWWWYSLWLPTTIAAASVTPRELTHYVHEAVPALAIGVAALIAWLWPRHGWRAAPAAIVTMIVCCEAVLILPAQQSAFLTRTKAPAPLQHNVSYPGLARYYANWFAMLDGRETWQTYDRSFPVNPEAISAEARLLRTLAPPSSRLLVLGGPPDLYFQAGMLPGGPFLIENTAYFNAPEADQETTASIRSHRATVVVVGSVPGWDHVDWVTLLVGSGFDKVASHPYAVYVATH